MDEEPVVEDPLAERSDEDEEEGEDGQVCTVRSALLLFCAVLARRDARWLRTRCAWSGACRQR